MQIRRIPFLISVVLVAVLYQNCAPVHEANSDANGQSQGDLLQSVGAFEDTLYPLLQDNCAQCHGVNQQPLFAVVDSTVSQNNLLNFGLVDLNNPASSRLVQKINEGHQSFTATLANDFEAAITAWSDQVMTENPDVPLPAPPVLEATFKSIHALILVPKCVGCHSPTGTRRREDYSNYQTTIQTGKVTPGDPQDSAMYTECESGEMPDKAPPLSDEELMVIRDWILAGAPNN